MRTISLIVSAVILLTSFAAFGVDERDWLNDAYEESHESMADPYSSDLEADDLFDTSSSICISQGGISAGQCDSAFVRFAQFLLRLVVVLAIPMLLYAAIRMLLAFGDKSKFNKALKMLLNIALGVLLALASVMIIFLVIALTRSSLNFFA